MRKIISKHEEAKKRKRNQIIVGSVLIAVMLFSVLGYAFENYIAGNTGNTNSNSNSTQTRSYNGINFANQNGYWAANYGGHRIVFSYFPGDIPQINNLTATINNFTGKPLYLYSENDNATSEVQYNLIQFASSVIPVQNIPSNCTENYIVIQNGQDNISQNQNCIYISGEGQDLIINTDSVLFKLFGIT